MKDNFIRLRISGMEKEEIKKKAETLQMSMSEYILMLIRRDRESN